MKKTAVYAWTLFACFTVVCFSVSVSAQDKFELKLRYPEGKYEMTTENVTDMTTDMGGRAIPMNQSQTQYAEIIAGPVAADGSQQVSMEIKRVVSEQKGSAGMSMKFDSDKPDSSNPQAKAMGFIVGMKLTLTYDKDGKAVKVDGWDEFIATLEKSTEMPKEVVDMLKGTLSAETFTKNINAAQDVLPKKPVEVGANWKSESELEIPMIGNLKNELDNKLLSVETVNGVKLAAINSKAKIDAKEGTEVKMGPMTMQFKNMDIETDTTYKLDIASGLLQSSVGDLKMSMEMDVPGLPAEMQAPKMSGTGKVTVTVKKAE